MYNSKRIMKILALAGDGIGPEISQAVLTCLNIINQKLKLDLEISTESIGLSRYKKYGTTIPKHFIEKVRLYDGIILGPLSTLEYLKYGDKAINVSSMLRKKLDLYANIRPSFSIKGISKVKNMDLVIVRENTEGFFADRNMFAGSGEFMPTEDIAFSIRKITAYASRRITKVACELAMVRRKHIAVVHKINTLKLSDGLFLKVVRETLEEYPEISLSEILIDAAAAKLIKTPEKFDIILTTNLFGDILSDEASELAGSLGIASSLNFNDNFALAQAVHGSAPDIAGLDIANPVGLLLSVALLFQWYGRKNTKEKFIQAYFILNNSVKSTLQTRKSLTQDLGGKSKTSDFVLALINQIHLNTKHFPINISAT